MELLASLSIQAPDRTVTEDSKLSEAQWRSLYHTEISFILRGAIKYAFLKNPYKAISQCLGNCLTGEKTDNLLFSSYVKSLLWDTPDVPVMSLKMNTHLWVRWTQNLNMQDKEVNKPATRCSQEWVTKAKDIEVKTRVMFKFMGSGKKHKLRPISLAALSVR